MLIGLFEADFAIKTNVMDEEPALVAWLGEHSCSRGAPASAMTHGVIIRRAILSNVPGDCSAGKAGPRQAGLGWTVPAKHRKSVTPGRDARSGPGIAVRG